jgi:hypothetical protein
MLSVGYLATQMGFGAAAVVVEVPWQFYNDEQTIFSSQDAYLARIFGTNPIVQTLDRPVRLRRDARLIWDTKSTGAGVYEVQGIIGLFPAGLGQDGSV